VTLIGLARGIRRGEDLEMVGEEDLMDRSLLEFAEVYWISLEFAGILIIVLGNLIAVDKLPRNSIEI
jgi:hypothetical protein